MTLRAADELPVPQRGRWQPLRTGLVDLVYYYYQEFWFRDGRLMLIGNNGTGKSKVLAQILDVEREGDSVEVGETVVRFGEGGPQGRPELFGELFV